MNALNVKKVEAGQKQEALDIVIAELERSLNTMESNYRNAVSTLQVLKTRVETDDLTRLLRRGAFMGKVHNLLAQSLESERSVTIMMIDVDHFKKVNDNYGHQTGDAVLERVSELIRQYVRPCDLAGRYGGEEIIVAIQGDAKGDIRVANEIAQRIRQAVESSPMLAGETEFTVTLSVGVASSQDFGFDCERLIGCADEALYEAKESGRNRVVNAKPPFPKTVLSLNVAKNPAQAA